jgi:hypothetical protein
MPQSASAVGLAPTSVNPQKQFYIISFIYNTVVLEEFPPPTLSFDEEGETTKNAWAFRGVSSAAFALQPSTERVAKTTALEWSALEVEVGNVFRFSGKWRRGVLR